MPPEKPNPMDDPISLGGRVVDWDPRPIDPAPPWFWEKVLVAARPEQVMAVAKVQIRLNARRAEIQSLYAAEYAKMANEAAAQIEKAIG